MAQPVESLALKTKNIILILYFKKAKCDDTCLQTWCWEEETKDSGSSTVSQSGQTGKLKVLISDKSCLKNKVENS